MKLYKFATLLWLLAFSFYSSASNNRTIAYAQQETPGAIIVISVLEEGKKYFIGAQGLGKENFQKITPIQKEEFEKIWKFSTTQELNIYSYSPGSTGGMATPDFTTVSFKDSKGLNVQFKFPNSALNPTADELIKIFKSFIPK